jgi:hypothetical protein
MCGALVRFHDPRVVHRRLAEVLEPFGGTSFTGDAGQYWLSQTVQAALRPSACSS